MLKAVRSRATRLVGGRGLLAVPLYLASCVGFGDKGLELAGRAVSAPAAMVTSAAELSSQIGAEILRKGGNAVDAAIATGCALAVTYPQAGNIGGGGFMVIRFPDGTATTLDFREKAPLAAHPEMFLDEDGEYSRSIHHDSHLAVGVPGTVAGLALAHESYGTLPYEQRAQP